MGGGGQTMAVWYTTGGLSDSPRRSGLTGAVVLGSGAVQRCWRQRCCIGARALRESKLVCWPRGGGPAKLTSRRREVDNRCTCRNTLRYSLFQVRRLWEDFSTFSERREIQQGSAQIQAPPHTNEPQTPTHRLKVVETKKKAQPNLFTRFKLWWTVCIFRSDFFPLHEGGLDLPITYYVKWYLACCYEIFYQKLRIMLK
jgi:hypothetical protein